MARSLNRVTLLGNLGKDPEVRTTPQGSQVCTLNMATTESYKDKQGNWQDVTDWHRVIFWDKVADIAGKYLKKGSKIMVEGKIRTRSYEDQSGATKYITEVVGRDLFMLDSAGGSTSSPSHAGESSPDYDSFDDKDSSDDFDDDVPF